MSRPLFVGAFLATLSACASVPRNAGFDHVATAVRDRGVPVVAWRTNTRPAIDSLLARELSATDAVSVAVLNAPALQARFERLGVARAGVLEAGTLANPVLDLRALAGDGTSVVAVGLTQHLFGLFQLPKRRRVANAELEATRLAVAQAVLDVAEQTRAAYFDAVATTQRAELDSVAALATQLAAELAQRQHAAGNIPDADHLTQRALAEHAAVDLDRSRHARDAARERLGALLGLAGTDTTWRIPSRLAELPENEPSLAELDRAALQQRLDLAAARANVVAAGSALGLTGAATLVPDIAVGVETEREASGERLTGPTLSLPIPLFDRGGASRVRGDATLRAAQQSYLALALDVQSRVRATRLDLLAARAQASRLRTSVIPLRHRLVDARQREYNAMVIGVYDLLDAKRDEIAAGREYIDALHAYWRARSALDAAVGQSFAPPATPVANPLAAPAAAPSMHEHHHQETR